MKGLTFFFTPFFSLLLCLLCLTFKTETEAALRNGDGVYIVYMGSASSAANAYRAQILINTMFKRRGSDIVHTYKHGFTGFAARLTAEEAKEIAKKPGVVSVFPDPNYQLHTTHSWDFLKYQTAVKIDSGPPSSASSDGSYDSIIGVLDTGIWPESESFNDKDMGPIPSRWKGTCMEAKDFNSSNCNRKIIGARFYKNPDDDSEYFTTRDVIGHGSHVSSTAAGSAVENASYYGVASGTAKGGSPNARIAMYKVCNPGGCTGSSILAAFDDAIADGVDVLSLSLGAPSYARIELHTDPIAIGAFHAVEQGIVVVCSAGNDGPDGGTVVNTAPWIMTVAANTIDRDLESDVVLGGNKVIKGEGIHFGNVSKSPVYPLIHGKSAKDADASEGTARACESGSLDQEKVKGKIVICENVDGSYYASNARDEVKSKGGIGCIFVDDKTRAVASYYGSFPTTVVDSKEAAEIFSYLNSTKDPVATILPTVTVEKFTPAPSTAYFSSRGPSSLTRSILKPDITAPGVAILAAWTGKDSSISLEGKPPSQFNVISGTSMAAPHATAVASLIKSQHPTWGPSAIRSAIMTTGNENKTVNRTVTNVGGDGVAVYTVSVETPPGFNIQVTPEKLQFTKDGEKLTYQVIVSAAAASLKKDVFGALTWSNANGNITQELEAFLKLRAMTRCFTVTFLLFTFLLLSVIQNCESEASKSGDYIIYMGAASSDSSTGNDHVELMSSMLKRSGKTPRHRYKHGFSGFAAYLSEDEASLMAKQPGVVSVFPDQMIPLHTTRSWDFLVQESYQREAYFTEMNNQPELDVAVGDTIIGFIDSGIWPESQSFDDRHMSPVPEKWKGTCMRGKKTNPGSFRCNKKIIGARYYNSSFLLDPDYETPRDYMGHGTHVASIAAGRIISDASYYGMAGGTMRGGSPTSRIAMYRACSILGCRGSSILAAFDDAIADGVDVISISMGLWPDNLLEDPISIGSFHAVERGITVVCAAGNFGPASQSVVNAAPWMITVAASTIDRGFESNVLLGGGNKSRLIQGVGINVANIDTTQANQIIHGRSAKKIDANEEAARNCAPDTMNRTIVEGKIVVCDNDVGQQVIQWKSEEVKRLGGTGMIIVDDKSMDLSYIDPSFLVTIVKPVDGLRIMSYINSTREPIATIMPTRSRTGHDLAPSIPSFSSRGPYLPEAFSRDLLLLQPDIAAPGVNILASWLIGDLNAAPQGKPPPLVNIESGTSMSCPHVSGIAARLKSENPYWTPAAIRSAIMTTAVQTTNTGSHITTETGDKATPYDFGAGQVTVFGPSSPGLVYETDQTDYLRFLCYYGFTSYQIRRMSNRIPQGFACPEQSDKEDISNINYPSISISNFNGEESRSVIRTLTNVASRLIGDEDTVYTVSIDAPKGLQVSVTPRRLHFRRIGDKLSYQVMFSSSTYTLQEDAFGSITWSNGMYRVRSPFAVTSKADDSDQ
ncbi:unnamed protein product [Thlaspi arvense]|uniref:CO(2)-response secreted protease n=1 Tax=Thlaspi arvense TaxID=13288 RepID=A0AAU9RBE7_THLAR|nr:unnamed protein product [Thlaspi arvense]